MGYGDDFHDRLARELSGDLTFTFAAGYRDEVRRARSVADEVKTRWTGFTALSSDPKREVDEALAKVNLAWDIFYGWLSSGHVLAAESDWRTIPVSWVATDVSYEGRANDLVQALRQFYVAVDVTVATYGNTSTAGDAAGGAGDLTGKLEKDLLALAKPLAIAAGVVLGLVVLVNVIPLFLKKG